MKIDLKEGQTFYYYNESVGLSEYSFLKDTGNDVLIIINNKIKSMSYDFFNQTSPTKEEAQINFVKLKQLEYENSIKKLEREIRNIKNKKEKFNKRYKFLEDEFPEYFL